MEIQKVKIKAGSILEQQLKKVTKLGDMGLISIFSLRFSSSVLEGLHG
jgi:hypothetical protein